MLDNVVEFSNLPIQQQQNEILYKRRHGMGIFGLGSALCMLRIRYGTPEAIKFTRRVMLEMSIVGYQTGVDLAKEKGPAPIFNHQFEITPTHARFNQFGKENIGKTFYGRDLFVQSSYIQRLIAESADYDLLSELQRHGCRFTHHTSVAPTGTISLALGNNASNGVEPDFSHHYYRNLTVEGKKTRQQEAVYSKSFLEWKAFNDTSCTDEELLSNLPDYFATADSLTWKEHIDMMAAAQEFTDSSISKTVNVPTDISFEEFKDVYQYAYDKGCKSVATYRYNPETLGAILTRSEDLESSRYQFTLEDGTVLECKGSDKIQYDGEITTAENLFNSLKEKIYGRF
jgi:ribonucleoside-diphosphate reductase alpha chain